jgi:hypothetical protein
VAEDVGRVLVEAADQVVQRAGAEDALERLRVDAGRLARDVLEDEDVRRCGAYQADRAQSIGDAEIDSLGVDAVERERRAA